MQCIKVSVLKSWYFLVNKVEVERGITSREECVVFTGNPHCKQCPPVLLLPFPTQKFCLHEEWRQQTSSCHQINEICLAAMGDVTHQPTREGREEDNGCCLWCQDSRSLQDTKKPLSSPPCTVQSELKDGLNSAKHSNFCLSARMEGKTQISLNGRAELEPLAREVPAARGFVSGSRPHGSDAAELGQEAGRD